MWDKTLAVNLRGQLNLLRACLPRMRERGGSIALVSSISAVIGDRDVAAYAASKAALTSLAKQTACEEARHSIRCNAVLPGWIDTPINDAVFDSGEQRRAEVTRTVPLGREGSPAEVAALVAYLGSDEAAYITGTTVLIDGGYFSGWRRDRRTEPLPARSRQHRYGGQRRGPGRRLLRHHLRVRDRPTSERCRNRVRLGDHALALFAAEPDTPHATSGVRPGFDHVSIRVDDVDTLYADVRLSRVPWLSEPESLPEWELRVLGFLDPEGNLFYFVSQLDDPGVPRSMSIGS